MRELLKRTSVTSSSRNRYNSLLAILLNFVLSACTTFGHAANGEPIDCTLPHTDTRINKCDLVRHASEFGQCLKAADLTEHTCIVMDANLQFCENEPPLSITAWFNESSKTLDCAGGTIDHGWNTLSSVTGSHKTELANPMPMVRLFDDRSLSDITVRNCTLRGTNSTAIEFIRLFTGELGGDGKLGPDEALPVGHHDLVFEDLTIQGVGTGIYLGNFSENVSINRVQIDGSRRIALYSEAGSNKISITNSVFANNQTREAVAIDSTYNSEISDNLFLNNREGGMYLYQNCGELKGTVCPVVRSTPPDNNLVKGNTFINNGVAGLKIASRQGRNHALGWCKSLNGLPGKFTDTANNNRVENNRFECDQGTSLIVMDGPNSISGNQIVAEGSCVPYEISTGGLGAAASSLLRGIEFRNNKVESARPPRLRNIGTGVVIE